MNRNFIIFIIILFQISVLAEIAEVKKDNARVYKNLQVRMYEKASFYLEKGEIVKIMEQEKEKVQIKTRTGKIGWIEKRLLTFSGTEKTSDVLYSSENIEINGYLDYPNGYLVMSLIEKQRSGDDNINASRGALLYNEMNLLGYLVPNYKLFIEKK